MAEHKALKFEHEARGILGLVSMPFPFERTLSGAKLSATLPPSLAKLCDLPMPYDEHTDNLTRTFSQDPSKESQLPSSADCKLETVQHVLFAGSDVLHMSMCCRKASEALRQVGQ